MNNNFTQEDGYVNNTKHQWWKETVEGQHFPGGIILGFCSIAMVTAAEYFSSSQILTLTRQGQ